MNDGLLLVLEGVRDPSSVSTLLKEDHVINLKYFDVYGAFFLVNMNSCTRFSLQQSRTFY